MNRATHDYAEIRRETVRGWSRAWRHTSLREVAFLTAIPDPKGQIDGLSAAVPGGDWSALDAREFAYERCPLDSEGGTVIYAIAEGQHSAATQEHPILLSYLDVVVQGYLREFGEAGAALFFATTKGWEAPILDDRSAPRYPRHQRLTRDETLFVDDALDALDARLVTL